MVLDRFVVSFFSNLLEVEDEEPVRSFDSLEVVNFNQ